jgi:hypothetical protein
VILEGENYWLNVSINVEVQQDSKSLTLNGTLKQPVKQITPNTDTLVELYYCLAEKRTLEID